MTGKPMYYLLWWQENRLIPPIYRDLLMRLNVYIKYNLRQGWYSSRSFYLAKLLCWIEIFQNTSCSWDPYIGSYRSRSSKYSGWAALPAAWPILNASMTPSIKWCAQRKLAAYKWSGVLSRSLLLRIHFSKLWDTKMGPLQYTVWKTKPSNLITGWNISNS